MTKRPTMTGHITSIRVDEDVWRQLSKKKKLGQSFNDVLRELLAIKEAP